MILNKSLTLARLYKAAQHSTGGVVKQAVRHSGGEYAYRAINPPLRRNILLAEAGGGLAWWWILWHVFTEPGHLIGEFPYPEPEKWTDAELGIPADDE